MHTALTDAQIRVLLLDVGDGSVEIALGRDAGPELAVSLPLGAGRLTRLFLPDDLPRRSTRTADVRPWALREGIMLHCLQSTQGEFWTVPLQHVRPDHVRTGHTRSPDGQSPPSVPAQASDHSPRTRRPGEPEGDRWA
jgi:hypothetical protein